MNEQNLNPRNREWPESDPEYGEVLEEQFFECKSGPKRVAVVKQRGEHFLSFHKCYIEEGEVKFGCEIRFKLDDGTAVLALQLADRILFGMLQEHLSGDVEEEA